MKSFTWRGSETAASWNDRNARPPKNMLCTKTSIRPVLAGGRCVERLLGLKSVQHRYWSVNCDLSENGLLSVTAAVTAVQLQLAGLDQWQEAPLKQTIDIYWCFSNIYGRSLQRQWYLSKSRLSVVTVTLVHDNTHLLFYWNTTTPSALSFAGFGLALKWRYFSEASCLVSPAKGCRITTALPRLVVASPCLAVIGHLV